MLGKTQKEVFLHIANEIEEKKRNGEEPRVRLFDKKGFFNTGLPHAYNYYFQWKIIRALQTKGLIKITKEASSLSKKKHILRCAKFIRLTEEGEKLFNEIINEGRQMK